MRKLMNEEMDEEMGRLGVSHEDGEARLKRLENASPDHELVISTAIDRTPFLRVKVSLTVTNDDCWKACVEMIPKFLKTWTSLFWRKIRMHLAEYGLILY